jgi:hypothetical protein
MSDQPDLATLLDSITAFLRRFLASLSDHHFDVLALWVVHTHAIAAADATPYLHITSPEKECGKTRVLEVLDLLANTSAGTLDPTPAALYRGINSGQVVTLLLDEVDRFFAGGSENNDAKTAVVGILNGGYRRGLRVPRVTDGRHLEWFNVFGPKVLAGIGELPGTLASRSLRILMRKRRRDESVERLRYKRVEPDAAAIVSALVRWVTTPGVIDQLAAADPTMPDELGDREQDVLEPLAAIADLAGAEWSKRARAAFLGITGAAHDADVAESRGTILLGDVRAAFDTLGTPIASDDLCSYLNRLDERPWGGWNEGKGIDGRRLAKLLKPYDVKPRTVRPKGWDKDKTARGYMREWFNDAFARYLPSPSPTDTTNTTAQLSEKPADPIRHNNPSRVGSENSANQHGYDDVSAVSDGTPGGGGESQLELGEDAAPGIHDGGAPS